AEDGIRDFHVTGQTCALPIFERTHGLPQLILLVDDVAAPAEEIHPLFNGQVDNAPPGRRCAGIVAAGCARQATGRTANVDVSGEKQSHGLRVGEAIRDRTLRNLISTYDIPLSQALAQNIADSNFR